MDIFKGLTSKQTVVAGQLVQAGGSIKRMARQKGSARSVEYKRLSKVGFRTRRISRLPILRNLIAAKAKSTGILTCVNKNVMLEAGLWLLNSQSDAFIANLLTAISVFQRRRRVPTLNMRV
jgi:hypothetical protein